MRILLFLAFVAAAAAFVIVAVPTTFLMPGIGWVALALALYFLDCLIGEKVHL